MQYNEDSEKCPHMYVEKDVHLTGFTGDYTCPDCGMAMRTQDWLEERNNGIWKGKLSNES